MEIKENSLVGNLKEFTALQAQYAKVRTLQPIKAVQEMASKKINDLKTELSNQAKYYNQNKKITNEALVEYANELSHISNEFHAGIASLEEKRQNIEKLELQAITRMAELKEEIKEGQKTEEYKSWKKAYDAYTKTAEIKEKSGNINEMLKSRHEVKIFEKENPLYTKILAQEKGKECLNKCKQLLAENDKKQSSLKLGQLVAMDTSLEIHNKAIANITKQSIFRKTRGFIVNKINGSKKFENNVMKPLRENLKELKEKRIPEMSKNSREIVGDVIKNINIKEVLVKGKEDKDTIVNELSTRLKGSN